MRLVHLSHPSPAPAPPLTGEVEAAAFEAVKKGGGTKKQEEMVKKICIDRGVAPHQTYIDSGYESGRAYDRCARFGWVAIKGDDAAGYPHRKAGGGTVQRLMSKRKTFLAPCGKRVSLIHLAVNPLKDILARLRGGEGAAWQVVPDIGDSWVAQIDSEER